MIYKEDNEMKIAEVIVRRLNDKRYKKNKPTCVQIFIDGVSCCQRISPKDSELVRVTHEKGLGGYINPIELIDYDSIVEALVTASSLGYFIRHFDIEEGALWLSIEKNYNIENLTPELIESIARKIERNRYDKFVDDIFKGMP